MKWNFWKEEVKETNFGEEIRKLMTSKDFEAKLRAASPFLIGSLIAWPAVWINRGLQWPAKRETISLPLYIRKTFYQAKAMQMLILSMGIIVAIKHDSRHRILDVHEA